MLFVIFLQYQSKTGAPQYQSVSMSTSNCFSCCLESTADKNMGSTENPNSIPSWKILRLLHPCGFFCLIVSPSLQRVLSALIKFRSKSIRKKTGLTFWVSKSLPNYQVTHNDFVLVEYQTKTTNSKIFVCLNGPEMNGTSSEPKINSQSNILSKHHKFQWFPTFLKTLSFNVVH